MPLQEQLKRDISILPEHVLEMFSLIVQDYKKMNMIAVSSKRESLSSLRGSCDDETFVIAEDMPMNMCDETRRYDLL